MSDVLYPLGKIESSEITLVDHTVVDAFEDGSSSSRRIWSASHFKRRIQIKHAPLSETDFRCLRSFFGARSGRYDPFWFRDNVHRTGNVRARLAENFPAKKSGSRVYELELKFEEVSPIRLLPDREDVFAAAGAYPIFWFDANRELFYLD